MPQTAVTSYCPIPGQCLDFLTDLKGVLQLDHDPDLIHRWHLADEALRSLNLEHFSSFPQLEWM